MKPLRLAIVIAIPTMLFFACGEEDSPTGGNNGPKGDGSLPMYVSANFVPSGYMGDGETGGGTTLKMGTTGCPAPRTTGAMGDCYKIEYTPGAAGWAGIYWQYPANNWGALEGKTVEAGATGVSFSAAAATDGQKVKFFVGGINNGLTTGAYGDAIKVEKEFTLGTAWQTFTLDLAGAPYAKVLGGFGWSVDGATATAPIVFYVDDAKWVK